MTRRRRRRIAAAAALVVVAVAAVLVVRSLPGEAPPDRAATFLARDTEFYADVLTDPGGAQGRRAGRAAERVPLVAGLRDRLLAAARPYAGGADVARDVRPWLGREAAVAEVYGGDRLALFEARDVAGARRFTARVTRDAAVRRYGTAEVRDGPGVSAAVVDGFALVGTRAAVRRAIDVHAGNETPLAEEPAFRRLRGELPEDRVAHVWAAGRGASLPVGAAPARLLELAGVPRLRVGMAAVAFDEGRVRATLRGAALPRTGSADRCAGPEAGREPALPDRAPRGTIAYAGFSRLDCLVEALAAPPRSGVGDAIARFATTARRGPAGVDLQRELLPRLRGEAALFVTGGGAPALTVMVDGVERRRVLELLGRLQPALIRRAGPGQLGAVPAFETRRLGGLEVLTVALAPGLELSYAVYDGKLVVSTSPAALVATRRGGGLEGREQVEEALGDRPERPTALVFLALDQLLALGDRLGPADDPGFLTVRDALTNLGATGATFSREGEDTTAEVSLFTP